MRSQKKQAVNPNISEYGLPSKIYAKSKIEKVKY